MPAAPITRVASHAGDRERRARLARMRRRAASLLVVAAVVLVPARRAEDDGGAWVGYVRAAAEAALVGGLADWFAVTALFRRPGGLPIPHTAVIVTRKDRIGASLAGFVQANFLAGPLVAARVRAASPTRRVADAILAPGGAAAAAERVGAALAQAAELIDPEAVASALERPVRAALTSEATAAALGGALGDLVSSGRHRPAVDRVLGGLGAYLVDHRAELREHLGARSPWWVPGIVDDRVFAELHDTATAALAEVQADPDHPVRRRIDDALAQLAASLRDDPDRRASLSAALDDAFDAMGLTELMTSALARSSVALRDDATGAATHLRSRVEVELVRWAQGVRSDPAAATRLDDRVALAVDQALDRHSGELSEVLESIVIGWDPVEVSDQLELALGPDLQFIRINGTLVGALIGLLLHAVGGLAG